MQLAMRSFRIFTKPPCQTRRACIISTPELIHSCDNSEHATCNVHHETPTWHEPTPAAEMCPASHASMWASSARGKTCTPRRKLTSHATTKPRQYKESETNLQLARHNTCNRLCISSTFPATPSQKETQHLLDARITQRRQRQIKIVLQSPIFLRHTRTDTFM